MITLRQLINRYLYVITFILIIFSIMTVSYVQIKLTQDHYYDESLLTLSQIEQIIHENAEELGIDKNKIIVGGESAGGGLAVAVCLYARDNNIPVVVFGMSNPENFAKAINEEPVGTTVS